MNKMRQGDSVEMVIGMDQAVKMLKLGSCKMGLTSWWFCLNKHLCVRVCV